MDTSKLSSLERKVYENFLGKKIKTQSGWTKGLNIDYLEFPFVAESGESYRVHLRKEYKSLYLFNDVTVKDCNYSGGGYGVTYYKKELYFGTVSDDGILKEIAALWTVTQGLIIIHSAEEQRKLIADIEIFEPIL